MRGFLLVAFVAALQAQTVSSGGWTVEADGARGALSVSYDKLGVVMKDVRVPGSWSVSKDGARLMLRTENPRAGWIFEPRGDTLLISTTSADAAVTAQIPASKDRQPARLLDPRGAPVDWVGTNEVGETYGGSETRNRSYLPTRNPEVMYFALGQVSGSVFQSLFDRKTDTAIDFPGGTVMHPGGAGPDVLDATIPVPGSAVVRVIPDYYTKILGLPFYVPFDDTYFKRAPIVWSSWTSYYAEVTEKDIIRNADWLAEHLRPYGFEYVQLDDGYDRGPDGEHYWIEKWNREKFPHGPKWLADYIKSKGLRAGLWLVPNAYAGAVKEHPEWYVRDKQGKLILDYHTPSLDSSNPEVLAFLKKMFTTLNGWGFEYYKFDGEHAMPARVPSLDKEKLYSKADPVAAFRKRMEVIREAIGPKTFIEECPAGTPLDAIGYVNSYFNGHDLYNSWQGMYALFSSINANAFLNRMVVYLMPGEGLELGEPMTVEEAQRKRPPSVVATARTREEPLAGFGVNAAEARTLVTYIALTGVAYPLASVMPELPASRVALLKSTMPTMPIAPLDLFSRGTDMQWNIFKKTQPDYYVHNYPEILDLKVNAKAGVYDVVGFTNWRSAPAARKVSFAEKLGLKAGAPYLAFDYWQQKFLGVYKDGMEIAIEPHDTRVVLLHPALGRPQLIGLSRHITGAYSIEDQSWDAAQQALRGVSSTVPGDPYTLWFYIPDGVTVSSVKAGGAAVRPEVKGNVLKLTFAGRAEPVEWEICSRAGRS
ncbi:MAG: alpha-galactosidase [Acidobacteriota bacterium]